MNKGALATWAARASKKPGVPAQGPSGGYGAKTNLVPVAAGKTPMLPPKPGAPAVPAKPIAPPTAPMPKGPATVAMCPSCGEKKPAAAFGKDGPTGGPCGECMAGGGAKPGMPMPPKPGMAQ